MPLSRHRCVEVAAPYKPRVNEFVRVLWADDIRLYRALFHYSLLLITLSEAKQHLSLGLRRAGFPAGEPNRFRSKSHLHMLNNIMRHQYIQKIPDRHYTVGAESVYIHSALLQAAYLYQFYFITTTVFGRIVRVNPPLSEAIVSNGSMSCSSSSV